MNKGKKNKKNKLNKLNTEAEKLVNNNIIRKISNFLNDTFHLKEIKYNSCYLIIHTIFIFLISFVALFNNNIYHLCIILIIISLDAFSVVVLHECPLTTMEKKYMNLSCCDIRNENLKKMDILYNCDHNYEKQIELLINSWTLIAGKCACIIFLKTFNLKLFNYNNIYSN